MEFNINQIQDMISDISHGVKFGHQFDTLLDNLLRAAMRVGTSDRALLRLQRRGTVVREGVAWRLAP